MKESKKKAILQFVLLFASYIAVQIGLVVVSFGGTLSDQLQHFLTTALVIVYFIPLSLNIRKHADIAKVVWLQKAMKFVLAVLLFWTPMSLIVLIFR